MKRIRGRLFDWLATALTLVRIRAVTVAFAFGRHRPLRARVVLATAHKPALDGNLAAIHAELVTRRPRPRVLVDARPIGHGLFRHIRGLLGEMKAAYYLATSRAFIVDDYFFPIYPITPRPGTTIVQVWHASGAFKKFGHSVGDKTFGTHHSVTDRIAIHGNYDICLIGSRPAAVHYAEAFQQPLDRFVTELGIPRTDVLFGEHARRTETRLRERYRLDDGRKVILYAPTFRGEKASIARSPTDLDLSLLQRQLRDRYVMLVHDHPFVRAGHADTADLENFAVYTSSYPDINELMLVSDILLTDYSSAIFEFSLLGRPILFYAADLDAYERERGFYDDFRTWVPGPVFETTPKLAEFLVAGIFDTDRVERFARESFDVADGHATERFVDTVVMPALAGAVPRPPFPRPPFPRVRD